MDKLDFTDVSVLIPIRVDSVIRLENVLKSIEFLLSVSDINIYVLEATRYNNGILEKMLPENVNYMFVEDWDPIFHRTKYINQLFNLCSTKIISIWDADVIVPEEQLLESIEALRSGIAEVSFPYDGSFYDVPGILRDMFMETMNIDILKSNISKLSLPYGPSMGGGALLITSEAFTMSQGEDERFYGWGPEDWNRVEKWKVWGFRVYRPAGPLFHLSHPRDVNGFHSWDVQKINSFYILEQTKHSNLEELIDDKAN